MTLPFRRRHHDAEAGHDRARMLMSEGLLTTLEPDEAAWLTRHLDGCAECGRDWKAFRADHRLLRSLREQPPEPPRDLWARTSAALDREARRRHRTSPAAARATGGRGGGWRALPLGAAASVIVLAVVIGATVWPVVPPRPSTAPGGSAVGILPTPAPTGIEVEPGGEPLVIFRETANGSWELVYSEVDEVCPRSTPSCVPKPDEEAQSIDLGDRPSKVTMSPTGGELVIASASDEDGSGQILVVPVDEPGASPGPSVIVTEPPATPPASGETPGPPSPTPGATPPGAIAIVSGVRLVGDVAYSADGQWLAFSAEPSDDSTGPDLYLWSVGQPSATAVTSDHRTYFASWHGGQVLASRVELVGTPAEPGASVEPGAPGDPGTAGGGQGNGGGRPNRTNPPTDAPASADPAASGGPSASPAAPLDGRPVTFLLDPATLEVTDLARQDVWLPVLDPSGRVVVYWSGTLRSDDGGAWALGTGELVLDRWSTDVAPPDENPLGSSEPTASGSAAPRTGPGPVGVQTILVPGAKATFEASFGPDGDHLAIWVGEALGDDVGRLHLVVLDLKTGLVATDSPLQGAPALRRFSIDKGRLAWVTPSGQDGQESSVQVLGWKGDNFGEIETEPASDLYLP